MSKSIIFAAVFTLCTIGTASALDIGKTFSCLSKGYKMIDPTAIAVGDKVTVAKDWEEGPQVGDVGTVVDLTYQVGTLRISLSDLQDEAEPVYITFGIYFKFDGECPERTAATNKRVCVIALHYAFEVDEGKTDFRLDGLCKLR